MIRICVRRMATSCDGKRPRVVIVGAGVIGLTVGVCLTSQGSRPTHQPETPRDGIFNKQFKLKQFPKFDVTIVAKEFTPFTTSDKAGGLIIPYEIGLDDSGSENIKRWSIETYAYLEELYKCNAIWNEDIGLNLLNVTCGFELPTSAPWYRDLVHDWKVVGGHRNSSALGQWNYNTFVVEGKRYLPWMMKQFTDNGGRIEKRKISDLYELKDYDLIINCSGLGARELVNDPSVYPIRGQIVAVVPRQPIKTVYEHYDKTSPLVIPHRDYVVLGGTDDRDCWSEEPDLSTTTMLYDQCVGVVPQLRGAEVVESWVGLRPARKSVRLELDTEMSKLLTSGAAKFPRVIHCYGHGGQGYVLHWGCAQDVMSLVDKCMTDFKHD